MITTRDRVCPYCDDSELDDGYCHECEFNAGDYEDVLELIYTYRVLVGGHPKQ